MSSIAAIDARCFLPPAAPQARESGDLDWVWRRPAETACLPPRRAEAPPANLNSLIARHFGLAAA